MKNENKRLIDDFTYAIQYYRPPTPLPDEWNIDLPNIRKLGFDAIQLRVQWRWSEPAEGKYIFDDIDKLFDLAEKNNLKVLFKFLMETAPDYIYQKYDGYRRDMHGEIMPPGDHGAFYVGGWLPCFDNPNVKQKAIEFVQAFVNRYKDRDSLILWNVWNEPRTRPIGECGCEYSIKSYQSWLRQQYGTIENLNEIFGKRWESFETIRPPGMPFGYVELFLWRKWAIVAVQDRLQFMYDTVRKIDNDRPIITHAGFCTMLADIAGDGTDDIENAKIVDFYGTSFPVAQNFTNIIEEAQPFLICDWLRSVDENYWVYELYPDFGGWHRRVSKEDFTFKVLSTLACGTKGIVYWQYRAERLGSENNEAGLVNMDGSFKDITPIAGEIADFVKSYEDDLKVASVRDDKIGILYSIDSDMISRIENTQGSDDYSYWSFALKSGYPYLYKKAIWGIYTLMREMGLTIRFCDERNLADEIDELKLLYVPQGYMLNKETILLIDAFIKKGGFVIAEEGTGLRAENTWLNVSFPQKEISQLFSVKIIERLIPDESEVKDISAFGFAVKAGGFVSYLEPTEKAEVIGRWDNGAVGMVSGKNTLFVGTSLGVSFYENYNCNYSEYIKMFTEILNLAGVEYESHKIRDSKDIYIRQTNTPSGTMLFIFNRSNERQFVKSKISNNESIKVLYGEIDVNYDEIIIAPKKSAVLLIKSNKA